MSKLSNLLTTVKNNRQVILKRAVQGVVVAGAYAVSSSLLAKKNQPVVVNNFYGDVNETTDVLVDNTAPADVDADTTN